MNKHIYYRIILGVVLSFVLFSCKKYLDKKPDNLLTEDQLWQTRANAEAYLYNVYSYVYNTDGGDWASMGASDESSVCIPTVNVRQMVSGNWSSASWYFYTWGNFLYGHSQIICF